MVKKKTQTILRYRRIKRNVDVIGSADLGSPSSMRTKLNTGDKAFVWGKRILVYSQRL